MTYDPNLKAITIEQLTASPKERALLRQYTEVYIGGGRSFPYLADHIEKHLADRGLYVELNSLEAHLRKIWTREVNPGATHS